MAHREDGEAALARREQFAAAIAHGSLDDAARAAAIDALAAIDAARMDAARLRLPQVARARIASPCSEAWDTMLGDGALRSCARCDEQVFDLSQMTLGQAEALVARRGGDLCVRLYQRRDRTMMFTDCVVGARGVVMRRLGVVGAAIAVGGAALALSAPSAPVTDLGIPEHARAVELRSSGDAFLHAGAEREPEKLPVMGCLIGGPGDVLADVLRNGPETDPDDTP